MSNFEASAAPLGDTALYLLAAACLTVGAATSSLFFASLVLRSKTTTNVMREAFLAISASLSLGLGIIFALLSSGVWL